MTNYLSPFLFNFNEVIDLDTEIMKLFQKSSEISEKFPEILKSIDEDLLSHALKKKKLRKEIHRYEENKKNDNNFLFEVSEQHTYEPMFLEIGRPRLKSELILYFLILRGVWGSISDYAASERIKDSISIRNVLAHYSYDIPGINTIRENLNAVTNKTRKLIMKCQSLLIIEKGLDDFSRIYIDSTHVSGNTSYPTDVSILYKLLDRAYRSFVLLNDFGFPVLDSWIETRQNKMKSHLSFISMNVGKKGVKGKVREKFKLMIKMADKNIKCFLKLQEEYTALWESSDLSPEKGLALDSLWFKIDDDIHDAEYVLYYAELLVHENIKLPARDKILSISDKDAAYIIKGQRNPVIGYKPQIARSGNGFICGYLTPSGNAADSDMFIPTVDNVISITGVVPNTVSTDDCYASQENVNTLKNGYNIYTVSINGAKGKKLTIDDWDTTNYINARNDRSAVESSMFTLKFRHHFGKLRRRGFEEVHAEQMEKVIAHNFIHMIRKEQDAVVKLKAS